MKNSTEHFQTATFANHESCNEKVCATCFENRGCMYDQYLVAIIRKTEEFQQQAMEKAIQQISRRA